jgi:hypothetical protein
LAKKWVFIQNRNSKVITESYSKGFSMVLPINRRDKNIYLAGLIFKFIMTYYQGLKLEKAIARGCIGNPS